MFFFDPLFLIISLPALLLALYAQARVRGTYAKYLQVPNWRRISGLEAAKRLLAVNGLGHVQIEGVPGELSDHYDPRTKMLRLSQGVASSDSVAAVAIVAHEVGHAHQDAQAYQPMRLRSGIVPLVNIGSRLGPILFLIGFFLMIYTGSSIGEPIAWLGVLAFAGAAVFALVTLPVELNASTRALQMLRADGLVADGDEMAGARSVLNAAALTYVAALASALSQLLYYVLLLSGSGRRRS
jgi:Zn-dependent membrane protease YugP